MYWPIRLVCASRFLVVATVAVMAHSASHASADDSSLPISIVCEGSYKHHLQGVCADDDGSVYWSFTTDLVRTDVEGNVIGKVSVANHHGDLCYHRGRVYVAVNLGKFNDPEGNADSWVYEYETPSLKLVARHETKEVFHGAGGIDVRGDHFFLVGGLPDGVEQNYVYEYDHNLRFQHRHVIESGWTKLGIQTAAWHDNAWWFGCYGRPQILLKTDADFNLLGRFEFDASLGITSLGDSRFYVARGPRTKDRRCLGSLHRVKGDQQRGLSLVDP